MESENQYLPDTVKDELLKMANRAEIDYETQYFQCRAWYVGNPAEHELTLHSDEDVASLAPQIPQGLYILDANVVNHG